MQHTAEVATVDTQMPPRPTTAHLMAEWHLITDEESMDAMEADANDAMTAIVGNKVLTVGPK